MMDLMPRCTKRFLRGCLASSHQTQKRSPVPGKPSDFDTHSRSVTAGSVCLIPPMPLRDRVKDNGRAIV